MHFIKTIISLVAFSGFAAAHQTEDDDYAGLSRREIAEIAREDYLVARDEYIEKRDLYLRATKKAAAGKKAAPAKGGAKNGHLSGGGVGTCVPGGLCTKGGAACGFCSHSATVGQGCLCDLDKH
ncbi:unnamed protein product [Clonostachys solani]|uniref:Uncharacterized protein n=1 Tax=Clonostachys solani TaxID=160281 RepID=A0A9P0ENB3_9HYPO|nr:unnamed protein product [Clonostachys solani]